jgi:hypothetical protein
MTLIIPLILADQPLFLMISNEQELDACQRERCVFVRDFANIWSTGPSNEFARFREVMELIGNIFEAAKTFR